MKRRQTVEADRPIFDSVIVVTDRRLLDKQLRDNIKDFSEVKNIVAPALSSAELRQSLEQGKKSLLPRFKNSRLLSMALLI